MPNPSGTTVLIKNVHVLNNYYVHMYLQLKNMINALFSSQSGGKKRFYERTNFGWKTIEASLWTLVVRMCAGLFILVLHCRICMCMNAEELTEV